jgi:acetyl-CoA/propionyl-CoA carboxylase carboxyl transferase subunit
MTSLGNGTVVEIPPALAELADPGTIEILPGPADSGVVTATVRVRGHRVACYVTDGRRRGGALTVEGCTLIAATIDLARRRGWPVVGFWHSGGAALHQGIPALDGVARVFRAIVRASGVVPQLSVAIGPAAGGAAYGAALTDIVLMTEDARIFVTGPGVVGQVTGHQVTAEELGGPTIHGRSSGVAHVTVADVKDAAGRVADLVDLLARPGSVGDVPIAVPGRDPALLLPASPRRAYDIRPLVSEILDDDVVVLHERWAPNVLTAFGRLAGRTVGVIANNPIRRGGCLDAAAGDKAARFVRLCDTFGLPLVVLVDVPGYLPGLDEERDGVVRRGAKLLHAFAAAQVPRVTVHVRKAYGGAYVAMNSKGLGATRVFAWPSAEIGIMNAESAVSVLHRRRLAAATDDERDELRRRLVEDYEAEFAGAEQGVACGVIDAVIAPADTRAEIASVLAAHPARPAHLGNIPL